MEKVDSIGQMEEDTMENEKMGNLMIKVFILIQLGNVNLENGRKE